MGAVAGRDSESSTERETELFDILSNQRRRFAVYAIADEGEIELGRLAEQIAAWENEQPVEQVSSDERKRVYTALQQSHLPRLAEAGLIDYDDRAGVIRSQADLSDITVYMEVVTGREIPWNEYYLGLAGVGIALTAAVWTNAWPFAVFPDAAWLTAIVAALFVSAAAHTYLATGAQLGAAGSPPEVDLDD